MCNILWGGDSFGQPSLVNLDNVFYFYKKNSTIGFQSKYDLDKIYFHFDSSESVEQYFENIVKCKKNIFRFNSMLFCLNNVNNIECSLPNGLLNSGYRIRIISSAGLRYHATYNDIHTYNLEFKKLKDQINLAVDNTVKYKEHLEIHGVDEIENELKLIIGATK